MNNKIKAHRQWKLDTGLLKACEGPRLEKVQSYLNHGANINVENAFKHTPLRVAANMGHLEVVKLLVRNGADISDDTKQLISGVIFSAPQRPVEAFNILKYLIDVGVDASFNNGQAIVLAAQQGQLNMVKLFISKGFEIDKGGHKRDSSAYFNSTQLRTTEMARFFIDECKCDKMAYYIYASTEVQEMINIMVEKEKLEAGLTSLTNLNNGADLASIENSDNKNSSTKSLNKLHKV